MNVYITYDRYEHNEWFSVYNIETDKQRAIKHFKEEDLPSFLEYGPDDCHCFQLQRVKMTKEEYRHLCELVDSGEDSEEFNELFTSIFNCDFTEDTDIILFTDGCSDYMEITNYYCLMNNLDYTDDEVLDMVNDKLQNNEDLFNVYMRKYINATY